jgi:putative transposase
MDHAMNRGDRLEAVFCDEDDRVLSVATLAESLGKAALGIQSVCLMSNHFHLMVERPNASLVEGMKGLLGVLGAGC